MKKILNFILIAVLVSSCTIRPIVVKKVGTVQVKEYSMKGATVELALVVENPNAIGFAIYKSDLNIKLNNIDLGSASIAKRIKVKRKSEKEYTVVLKSDFSKITPAMLLSMGQLFSSGKLNNATVAVNGQLKAGNLFYKKSFPVDVKEKINLGR
jgi:LEA14-like dessication related protein